MFSDKSVVNKLVKCCESMTLQHVVLCPGSRNVPLILSFDGSKSFDCTTIVDERSAGFFAIGCSQFSGKPTAIVCTSGTAVLNFAPAIAEAYYQHIPILVITADRPAEWIDKGDGQTIRQEKIYANYCDYSFLLTEETERHTLSELYRLLVVEKYQGPIHVNVPLSEPLYNTIEQNNEIFEYQGNINSDSEESQILKLSSKRLLILPINSPREINLKIQSLLKNTVVFSEHGSNVFCEEGLHFLSSEHVEQLMLDAKANKFFVPEDVITVDGTILSKELKIYLRKNKPKRHIHLTDSTFAPDVFGVGVERFSLKTEFEYESLDRTFVDFWTKSVEQKSLGFTLDQFLPSKCNLQIANSTPIRDIQKWKLTPLQKVFCNRGTNGIEGSMSTAVGFAYASRNTTDLTIHITGDLSFFYDSNALWFNKITSNLRIILINNRGGNIFRKIGKMLPSEILENRLCANQNLTAEFIAKTFDIQYVSAKTEEEIATYLQSVFFQSSSKPILLEIFE